MIYSFIKQIVDYIKYFSYKNRLIDYLKLIIPIDNNMAYNFIILISVFMFNLSNSLCYIFFTIFFCVSKNKKKKEKKTNYNIYFKRIVENFYH